MKTRTRFLVLALLFAGSAFGQPAQNVNQLSGPPPDANVRLTFYDGSGNLTYLCTAPQNSPASGNRWSAALSNLTNIIVTSNSGVITFTSTSYLWVGARITLSGSATAALNATYRVTAVSGSTATITTAGVGNGTYTDIVVTTNNPVLNQAVWAIQSFAYNGTNQLISSWWSVAGPSPNTGLLCSSRASY